MLVITFFRIIKAYILRLNSVLSSRFPCDSAPNRFNCTIFSMSHVSEPFTKIDVSCRQDSNMKETSEALGERAMICDVYTCNMQSHAKRYSRSAHWLHHGDIGAFNYVVLCVDSPSLCLCVCHNDNDIDDV